MVDPKASISTPATQSFSLFTHQRRSGNAFQSVLFLVVSILVATGPASIGSLWQAIASDVDAIESVSPSGHRTGWAVYANCPVLVEYAVDVPALESGVLEQVDCRLNAPVEKNAIIGRLDSELAELDVQMAQLQLDSARKLAEDTSDVDFQQLTLQELQEELEGYKQISESVSEGEIRRLTLRVGKARLTLIQARQARSRAELGARLQEASLLAARQRLTRRSIASPISGIVTRIDKRAGQWVEAGEVVARVEDLSRLTIDAIVPVDTLDLGRVVGSEVRVSVEATGEPIVLGGKVTSYDHKISSSGLVRIHSEIRNVMHRGTYALLPGMTVELHVKQ